MSGFFNRRLRMCPSHILLYLLHVSLSTSCGTSWGVVGGRGTSWEVVGSRRGTTREVVGDRERSSEVVGGRGRRWDFVGGRRTSCDVVGGDGRPSVRNQGRKTGS